MKSRIRIENDYIAVFDDDGQYEAIHISRKGTFKGIPLNKLSQAIEELLTDPFEWFEKHPINNQETTK